MGGEAQKREGSERGSSERSSAWRREDGFSIFGPRKCPISLVTPFSSLHFSPFPLPMPGPHDPLEAEAEWLFGMSPPGPV